MTELDRSGVRVCGRRRAKNSNSATHHHVHCRWTKQFH